MFTFLGALYIGMKQNEINQKLLDPNFFPSLEIIYSYNQFQIYNRGRDNIWLYGDRASNGQKDILAKVRMIPLGGYHYILGVELEKTVVNLAGDNRGVRIPLDLYIVHIHCQTIRK